MKKEDVEKLKSGDVLEIGGVPRYTVHDIDLVKRLVYVATVHPVAIDIVDPLDGELPLEKFEKKN